MSEIIMSKESVLEEMDELKYKEPNCDFEHGWNHAIDECKDVIDSGGKDE